MLQGNEAEGADTLFEGKGTKNNRDFQISRKIFQSVIGKNSVLLFILSTQFLGNFQRLDSLHDKCRLVLTGVLLHLFYSAAFWRTHL